MQGEGEEGYGRWRERHAGQEGASVVVVWPSGTGGLGDGETGHKTMTISNRTYETREQERDEYDRAEVGEMTVIHTKW